MEPALGSKKKLVNLFETYFEISSLNFSELFVTQASTFKMYPGIQKKVFACYDVFLY